VNKKVSLLTAMLVIIASLSIGALITYRQVGGELVWIDRSAEPGAVFWVSSTAGSNYLSCGRGPSTPCATIDYAIGRCTDDKGDVIYVMPGHVEEGVAATQFFDADVAGISIIGLGSGSDRPRLDYNYSDSTATIGAANVTIRNIVFRPGITSTALGITIEAAGDWATIENCEFAIGEASGTDEFVVAVELNAGANDVTIRNNTFYTAITDNGCTSAINLGLAGVVARTRIEDNYFYGNWSSAAIVDGSTAATEVLISENRIKVKDGEPGIELASGTTGFISDNYIESTSLANPDAAIVAAACSWFSNYVVTTDGAAPEMIGTPLETVLPIGTVFYTTTTVAAGASIATGGMALTGAASGTLLLMDVTIQVGATALASANGTAALEFYTDNVKGTDQFMHIIQTSLTAQDTISMDSYTFTIVGVTTGTTTVNTIAKTVYGRHVALASGKKIYIRADTQTFNAGGTFIVNCVWKRLSAGATIASR